uniref:mRNA guanylyltransferase n=1 Tax=Panagrolaimus sp. ES5 TaxID=591445 RepID=A0AC34FB72_9BILA
MSVSRKEFWDISETFKLFDPNFLNSLGHHVDGLIFQPSDPYTPGQFNFLMKWKPPEESSIDFKLKIKKLHHSEGNEASVGNVNFVGELFVHGLPEAFATIKVTEMLNQFDGRIIECNYKDGQWLLMRERTDKSRPNSYPTAKSVMETIKNPLTEQHLVDFIAQNTYVKSSKCQQK